MHIRYGYVIELACANDTHAITMLDVHPQQRHDLTAPDTMEAASLASGEPLATDDSYLDGFGNICRRLIIPAGGARLKAEGIIHHSGFSDDAPPDQPLPPPQSVPAEALPFLLGSRYCETELLSDLAWSKFGHILSGRGRVQAVCDFVHSSIRFGYGHARATRTAAQALNEGVGVCRDFAHLAVTLCRALNIPARYCNGYLGDIGVPLDPSPMDFSAWFEVYLDGAWWTFDARHNAPRIGRIVVARGRDATDVPMIHTFGQHTLQRFEVIAEEVEGSRFPVSAADRRSHDARRLLGLE